MRLISLLSAVALLALRLGPAGAIDTADPMANIEAWIKLTGDTSGKTVFRWQKGVAYAMPKGAASQPLLGLEGLAIVRDTKLPEGGYREQQVACGLYFDPATGAYIHEMTNPFTGKIVKLGNRCGGISGARFTREGLKMEANFAMESSVLGRPYLLQWALNGDRAVIKRVAHTKWVEPASGKTKFEITADTYAAKLSDLENPAKTSVDASYSWVSQTEWMTMLDMADRPGNMLWMMDGQKFASAADIPAAFRKAFEEAYPGRLAAGIGAAPQ